jgi:hypothetical protein
LDAPDVWVAKDDGTEMVRARDIATVSLDYNGNVTARLAGGEAAAVTLVGHRTRHDEHRPEQFHRELTRVLAELADSSGSHVVRPVLEDGRGWQWISEPL